MKRILALTAVWILSAAIELQAAPRSFAILADAGNKTANFAQVMNSVDRLGTRDLVLPGDNLYSGTFDSVWTPWRDKGFRFEVTAIGNHNGGYQPEIDYFDMPGEYYSKVYDGRIRFIVLNSDNKKRVEEQRLFLVNELEHASEPYVFLVYHHPSYTLSNFHKWTEKKDFQQMMRPLLETYRSKITALLVGHDHLGMLAEFGDLPVILSGAVMESRRDVPRDTVQDGKDINTLWYFDGKPHWARLSIPEDSDGAKVEFIRATDDSVRCTAHLQTGGKTLLESDCERSFTFASILRALFRI